MIRTERLHLRPARRDDLEDLHAVFREPEAMRFWSTLPHATLEQTREWLEAMIAIPPDEGEDFVVEHAGKAIGKAGLYRFPVIGFILHPDHWRRGFAREALEAVLDRAFGVHALPRVEADVDPNNIASQRLLQGLRFAETGRAERTWLVGEQWYDSVYLSLDVRDWCARRVTAPPPIPPA